MAVSKLWQFECHGHSSHASGEAPRTPPCRRPCQPFCIRMVDCQPCWKAPNWVFAAVCSISAIPDVVSSMLLGVFFSFPSLNLVLVLQVKLDIHIHIQLRCVHCWTSVLSCSQRPGCSSHGFLSWLSLGQFHPPTTTPPQDNDAKS